MRSRASNTSQYTYVWPFDTAPKHTTSPHLQNHDTRAAMNLSRLLARCPRGLPHISLTRQVGYSRAYTYVARGTQQNERGEEFLIKRLVAAVQPYY